MNKIKQMERRMISMLSSTAKNAFCFLLIICVAIGCCNKGKGQVSNRDIPQRKRAEAFISTLDIQQRLNLLLLETRGDTALLAKLLMAPEVSVKRLMAGEAKPTEHALKKTSRTFADIKEFNAEFIINAALNNKKALNAEKKQSVWEQMDINE